MAYVRENMLVRCRVLEERVDLCSRTERQIDTDRDRDTDIDTGKHTHTHTATDKTFTAGHFFITCSKHSRSYLELETERASSFKSGALPA